MARTIDPRTRPALLEAANRLFYRDGIAAVGVDDIVAAFSALEPDPLPPFRLEGGALPCLPGSAPGRPPQTTGRGNRGRTADATPLGGNRLSLRIDRRQRLQRLRIRAGPR